MIKNSRLYDFLKFLALVVLPMAATLYFALASVWDLPSTQEVVYAIVAVDAVLGLMLHISTKRYSSAQLGSIVTAVAPGGGRTFTLELEGSAIDDIAEHDEVRFRVDKKSQEKDLVEA